jgi:hypothetical protein
MPLNLSHGSLIIFTQVRKGADINMLSEDERDLFASPLVMACRYM